MSTEITAVATLRNFFVPGVRAIGHSVVFDEGATSKIVAIVGPRTVRTASGNVYQLEDPYLDLMTPVVARELGF